MLPHEVSNLKYHDMNELIRHSSSTRRYFLSLPVEMQLALHEHNDYIHTAEDLRKHVAAVNDYVRHVKISGHIRT